MTITVKFFAVLRDCANSPQTNMQLLRGATISQAAETIVQRFPALAPYMTKIAYAVNEHYVPPSTVLHDGDELALIPPVSGG